MAMPMNALSVAVAMSVCRSTSRANPGPTARCACAAASARQSTSSRLALLCLIAVIVMSVSACAGVRPSGDAAARLSTFQALPGDRRVRIEPGATEQGARVAALLPAAIAQVERRHGRSFAASVRVHVCGQPGCFESIVPLPPGLTAAVAFDNRLLLGSRLFDRELHRLWPVLVHELSHLHFGQRLGHYTPAIPVWFHEGFAAWVADGGGADLATDAQVQAAFEREAASEIASDVGAPGHRRRSASAVAPSSVAYRQAFWFVAWLATSRPENFAWFIDVLQSGRNFERAFADGFGETLAQAYVRFTVDRGLRPLPDVR